MKIDWDFESKGYSKILQPLEEKLYESLLVLMKDLNAPRGALPYLLRRIHRKIEDEMREEAKKVKLKLSLGKDQEDLMMSEIYPHLLEVAQENGFEEVGHYMAFCTLMGLASPISMPGEEDEDE